ncbi:MAG: hypothetical protein CME70_08820 [Halobacteriovorax sp.]|nr:hypothetical protein [Halobacteriovorax sp.]|tara:strand:- start:82791 stop:84029 length:1239 start_codon:yes stop_codon:yes gene_type:complete
MKRLSNKEKKELLSESKSFCILPWLHIEVQQDGRVLPCCRTQHYTPLGNVKDQPVNEIWNSEAQKDLRLRLLKSQKSKYCSYCYDIEDHGGKSPRQNFNQFYSKEIDRIDETKDDGTYEKMSLKYLGIRFSNLCNLECVYCSPTYSSRWAQREGLPKEEQVVYPFGEKGKILELVKENIDSLESLYIAGGEPLLEQEHLDLLLYLIEKGRTDISLYYNTNLTKLKFGKTSIIELWKSFKTVILDASIDSQEERNDFIRLGAKWSVIEKNIEEVKAKAPNVLFRLYITNTLLNVLTLPRFMKDSIERGWLGPSDINFNNLTKPEYFAVQNLNQDLKEKAKENLMEFIQEFLMEKYSTAQSISLIIQIKELINLMSKPQDQTQIPNLTHEIGKIQNSSGLKFDEIFPELNSLIK